MAMTNTHGTPVHRAWEDNTRRELSTIDARQGVVSGRVISVMMISTVLVAVIFAIIWLTGA
jgi:hypothetical protein